MDKPEYVKFHADMCEKMKTITAQKNSDYTGNSDDPFANFRKVELLGAATTEQGFVTRMTDKLARVIALVIHGTVQQVMNEAIEDTLLDLANYCILFCGYLRDKQQKKDQKALDIPVSLRRPG